MCKKGSDILQMHSTKGRERRGSQGCWEAPVFSQEPGSQASALWSGVLGSETYHVRVAGTGPHSPARAGLWQGPQASEKVSHSPIDPHNSWFRHSQQASSCCIQLCTSFHHCRETRSSWGRVLVHPPQHPRALLRA